MGSSRIDRSRSGCPEGTSDPAPDVQRTGCCYNPRVTVGIRKPNDPRQIPEHVLWVLVKDGRRGGTHGHDTARTGAALHDAARREDAWPRGLLWSMTFRLRPGAAPRLAKRQI